MIYSRCCEVKPSTFERIKSTIAPRNPGGGGGGGGGTWVYRGAHKLVIKIKKYPISTDFWPKKHPYFEFFHYINTPSSIKTLTLDEREHVF